MDWLVWVSCGAIFIGIWHEINRFPAVNKSFIALEERIESLEFDNRDLMRRVDSLENEVLSLSTEIDKIKDPIYHQAIEDGDGGALYNMDKERGEI
ncbi:hypothetical protein Misp06_00832 [Microbulbifer sp. NBRC 101763]